MDLSPVIDASLVLLGVAAVLFMGIAMLSPEFAGGEMNNASNESQPETGQADWRNLKAA
jgi:hypothetical protein